MIAVGSGWHPTVEVGSAITAEAAAIVPLCAAEAGATGVGPTEPLARAAVMLGVVVEAVTPGGATDWAGGVGVTTGGAAAGRVVVGAEPCLPVPGMVEVGDGVGMVVVGDGVGTVVVGDGVGVGMVVVGDGVGTVVVGVGGTEPTATESGAAADDATAPAIEPVRDPNAERTEYPLIEPSTALAVKAKPVVEIAVASTAPEIKPIRRRA